MGSELQVQLFEFRHRDGKVWLVKTEDYCGREREVEEREA